MGPFPVVPQRDLDLRQRLQPAPEAAGAVQDAQPLTRGGTRSYRTERPA